MVRGSARRYKLDRFSYENSLYTRREPGEALIECFFDGEIQAFETRRDFEVLSERLQFGKQVNQISSRTLKIHLNCFYRANVQCTMILDNQSV